MAKISSESAKMVLNQAQPSREITQGGKAYLKSAIDLHAYAFRSDPVLTYVLCSLSETSRSAYLISLYRAMFKAASLNKASFDEIDDFGCIGVMMPPGEHVESPWTLIPAGVLSVLWNLGWSGCKRMLIDYPSKSEAAKRTVLGRNEKYYYLFSIATREDRQGQGLCSELIRHYQDIAQKVNVPIWLEATTARSKDLYLRLDFQIAQEIVLGEGKVGPDGKQRQGGEGVRAWGMLWRPKVE